MSEEECYYSSIAQKEPGHKENITCSRSQLVLLFMALEDIACDTIPCWGKEAMVEA